MNTAVIYKSHYGFTETYAKWLSEDLGADLLQADRVKPADLQQYQTIVYGGGLYADGVNGITLLTKNFELMKDKALYLFTVGAADVTDPENLKNIRSALAQKLSPAMREKLRIYHLRGGLRQPDGFLDRPIQKIRIKACGFIALGDGVEIKV
jgi:flavodoxin